MTTLSDQINSDFWANVDKFKEQHYQWMLTHKDLATHAVTLTFDPTKIQLFLDKNKMEMKLNHPYLIQKYKLEMKHFGHVLRRSLFGKSAERFGERLLLIPCLEGMEEGKNPHYHCTIGVDASRMEVATSKILESWTQTRFCGHHNEVKLYRDEGWLGYNTKRCMFPKKEVIDWENVLVPSSSQSILG
jgi:hypothetical protein